MSKQWEYEGFEIQHFRVLLTTFLTEYRTESIWIKCGPFELFHPQVPFVLNSPYEESQYFSRIENFTKIDY